MKNINNHKHHHHHQISSFNYLRHPSFLKFIATNNRRSIDDASNNIGCFAAASQHRNAKIDEWPSSPRIGCMGQIKKSNSCNGRVSSNKKLFQFKKMFPSSNSSSSLEKNTKMMLSAKVEDDVCGRGISIADMMDMPLPVTLKHLSAMDAANLSSNLNLWNRRCKGVILQSLEIEQIKLHQIQLLQGSFSGSAVEKFEAQI